MNQNTVAILIALAFGTIGFTLGRVTCSDCCVPSHCAPGQCSPHGEHEEVRKEIRVITSEEGGDQADVQVMIDAVLETEFEGDTTITIDGGEIRIKRTGEDVSVEVEVED